MPEQQPHIVTLTESVSGRWGREGDRITRAVLVGRRCSKVAHREWFMAGICRREAYCIECRRVIDCSKVVAKICTPVTLMWCCTDCSIDQKMAVA